MHTVLDQEGAHAGGAGRGSGADERSDADVELRGEPMTPDLTFIVVTHNRAELALTTLRSARSAVETLHTQWIVVDSGSTDGTPDEIETAYPDVQIVREQNIGFAAANNRALPLARGRYVLLLNPDVETVSGNFDELVATLDDRPEIGIASVVQRAPDGNLQHSIRRFPSAWLSFGEAIAAPRWSPLEHWREEESRTSQYLTDSSADWLVGAFLIARAEALEQVGGLDERFFLYSEETDWCYRFNQAGWKIAHLPLMTVIHHTGATSRADLHAQLSYAKLLFARKHYGKLTALSVRAALALRHALRALGAGAFAPVRPHLAARARLERHALAVVLGLAEPPFRSSGTPGA
jgi:GT2 family glycosyltransferase